MLCFMLKMILIYVIGRTDQDICLPRADAAASMTEWNVAPMELAADWNCHVSVSVAALTVSDAEERSTGLRCR